MIDIGANLTHDSFDADREQVISDALAAGVSQFIITGSTADCSQQARDLAHLYSEHCFATAGVHPHYASQVDADCLETIEGLLVDNKVVSVGETGLDYFRDISPRPAQQFSFEQHIKLAIDTGLPMFLHQRDAHEDFFAILKEHRDALTDVVVHCFTDSKKALFDYLDIDCHIGITGWICDERRGKHLLDLVPSIPMSRLMIETDSPYLLPRTIKPKPKSRRNEPKNLAHIANYIANILDIGVEQLQAATVETSQKFFRIQQ